MIKACIFDMDGTTVNTLDSIAYYANAALRKFNLAPIETERYKILVGNGARKLTERMIKESGGDAALHEPLLEYYNKTYDDGFLYLARPYDGICELLKSLKERGIKAAILSNKPNPTTVKIADSLFGSGLIDLCFGGRDGVPLKPDPTAVFEITEKLGVAPGECLYIGDTATDIETGKNSGIFSIGVLWGFRGREELEKAGADAIVSSPNEILLLAEKA